MEDGMLAAEGLASRIKEARYSVGLTRSEFAQILGVTINTLSTWESGQVTPHIGRLADIAKASGFPLEWVRKGTT